MQQLNFEIAYADHNACKQLDSVREELVTPVLKVLAKFFKDFKPEREDQIEVYSQWEKMNIKETVWRLLTAVIQKDCTVQQLLGMFWHSIDCEIGQRKAKVMEPLFLALTASPFITLEKKGVEFIFSSEIELDLEEYGYILPSLDMPIVEDNNNIGYKSLREHVITGHKLKQHSKEVCLDHINRLNSTCYRVETRMLALYKPQFNPEPKIKSNGSWETPLDIQKRKESFKYYSESLPEKIRVMVQQGNKFHICHRYDNRLRTYAKAYHFDYIGQKYSRALVQPVISEPVEGANEYF